MKTLLGLVLGATLLASCASDGSLNAVAHVDIRSPAGDVLADMRWDGDVLFVIAGVDGTLEVYSKGTPYPILPTTPFNRGTMHLRSRSRDFRESYDFGEVLPAWLAAWEGWREGELAFLTQQFGLVFEAPTP